MLLIIFHIQRKRLTPRYTVKENLMPHMASAETPLVNHMGSYDMEKTKIRQEQNRDLRDYSEKVSIVIKYTHACCEYTLY